jgi:drug/metabolite transporter (DMT)-like permease
MIGLGVLYAILSTTSFSFNQISVRRGMLSGSAMQGVYVSVLLGAPTLLLIALATTQLFRITDISIPSYGWLAGAGVSHFLFGRYANYRAVGAIGANRARPIVQTNFIFSLGLAWLWLKEDITLQMWLGILLVMVGPMLLYRRGGQASQSTPAGATTLGPSETRPIQGASEPVTPRRDSPAVLSASQLAEGYFWGMVNAVVFGLTPLMVRRGLMDSEGLGVLGALVAYSAAAVVIFPTLVLPSVRQTLRSINPKSRRWFLSATFAVLMAQMFHFLALSLAPVSVVAPLQRAGSILILPLSYLFNRRVESFEPRVLAGIAFSIAGSLVIVL